jgi:hypothetical protein
MHKKRFVFNTAIFEIALLVSLSFAIAFILDQGNLVHADGFGDLQTVTTTGSKTPGGLDVVTEGAPEEGGFKTFTGDLYGGRLGTESLAGYGGNYIGTLLGGLAWAGTAFVIVQLIGNLFGLDDNLTDSLSYAAAGSFGTYGAAQAVSQNFFSVELAGGWAAGAGVVAAGVGIAIFVLTYKKEKKEIARFECLPFEPPLGGASCEECNKDPFRPCSEYRCKALGQACDLLNVGTTEEACTWVNRGDVNSPIIETWTEALKPLGLGYTPDSAIRPPNRGVKVVSSGGDGCLQAFTPLEFGILINEPAQCKLDYNHTASFDSMQFYMGGSNYYRYNHTQKLKLPGPDNFVPEEDAFAPELENDGFFSLFVRCRDANGNENVDEFVFNFCVDPSPDTTPPIVEGTSILDGSPVRFGADEVPIEVYVNEPAQCKWSRVSKNYDDMENNMDCATETYQINADLNYACTGSLTGIKNRVDNSFFFRCKDQPGKPEGERNVMIQSFPLTLRGSQELNILSAGPNGTIFGSTDTVSVDLTVRTDDGADEGKSFCYFSSTGETDSFIAMFQTDSFEHKQSLDLVDGDYGFFFRCIDRGGNSAEAEAEFDVFVDKGPPIVTRAYKAEGLKVVTNEEAECVYSLNSCNYEFNEGLAMIYSNPSLRMQHFAEWKTNSVYYVKCRDLYDNQPGPNECNIVVKSVDLEGKS